MGLHGTAAGEIVSGRHVAFVATCPAERWVNHESDILDASGSALLRDDDGGYSGGRYTIQRAGLWMFGVSGSLWADGSMSLAGAGVLIKANIGGTEKLLVAASGQASDFEGGWYCFANVSGSGLRELALNDEVRFVAGGGSIYTHSELLFWGLYLGPAAS